MLWSDLLVNRRLSAEEITPAVSNAFDIEADDVLCTRDIANTTVPEAIRLLCELSDARGEFPMLVEVFVLDDSLADRRPERVASQICLLLQCEILIADASPNPYVMQRVDSAGLSQRVYLDTSSLDERDEYVVSRLA